MFHTTESLKKAIKSGLVSDLSLAAINDYFGHVSTKPAGMEIISDFTIAFGIYTGLIKRGLPFQTIEQAMLKGKLNRLVHNYYRDNPTIYYHLFTEREINLDATHENMYNISQKHINALIDSYRQENLE